MSKYTGLITNYHATKPLFYQHVDLSTRPLVDVSLVMSDLIEAFDIDYATGVQLDALGKWIGLSRTVSAPIAGIYLEFDKEKVGWDQGVWQGKFDPDDGFTDLTDEIYRTVLKVKIAINNWNGQNDTIPDILDSALSGTGLKMAIVDNQDMSISVWLVPDKEAFLNPTERLIFDSAINNGNIVGIPADFIPSQYGVNPLDRLPAELGWVIKNNYLTVKAAGVRIREFITPSDGYYFFGFDVENDYIAGWDNGAWEGSF